MASLTFFPARLSGGALVPPSKSEAHRALLLAALGRGECRLNGFPPLLCDDTLAMINGITALGAKVRHDGAQLIVTPASQTCHPMAECCVHACAAALRMLIPAFLVRGQSVRFIMDQGLFKRPLNAFEPLFRQLGVWFTFIPDRGDGKAVIEMAGFLPAGSYETDASQSSQFASGMLIALSHAADIQGNAAPSQLTLTGPIVSRPYLDMTLRMMRHFHVPCTETTAGVFALSPVHTASPAEVTVNGDWSQAAVFLCANAMGSDIAIRNLNEDANSLQGDSRIRSLLNGMMQDGRLKASAIDCSDIPDLAPMLALVCSQADGISALTGVSRLRIKESDRLLAMQELLDRLGVHTEASENSDTLRIWGPAKLRGGFEADARGDHRLVMFLAVAALMTDAPITVHGVECITKSWPDFIQMYQQLGGKAE